MNKKVLTLCFIFTCLTAITTSCEDDSSSNRNQGDCGVPSGDLICECVDGAWVNCKTPGEGECKEADKPANATGCECIAGEWKNCTTAGETKECLESDKPVGTIGCTCNTSTGTWENCAVPDDPKECAEEDKPEGATDCECINGEWENCTIPEIKECVEENKPEGATTCECNTSTGEWEYCVIPEAKECAEEDKPEGATDCECSVSGEWKNCTFPEVKECVEEDKPEGAIDCECSVSGEWKNCTFPEVKECAEADKPEGATGCECNSSNGTWENCCLDSDKPAGTDVCECVSGEWQNCTYPELNILTDVDTFTVDEAETQKADIGVRLSTCPVMPTTVTAETQNPGECMFYSEGDECSSAKVCYTNTFKREFNGENCEDFKTFTVVGRLDSIDDDDAECKITLTATSDDTDPNTSYNGKTLEITGINQNVDKAGLVDNITVTQIKEWANDGSDKGKITLALKTRPTANVQVSLMADSIDYSTHLMLDSYNLEFTPSNYNTTQTITFSGVRDYKVLDPVDVVIHLMAFSDDPKYEKQAKSYTVKVNNIDKADVEISNTGTSLSENTPNTSKSFTVKLTSKPSAEVEVTTSSTNQRVRFATTNNSGSAQNTVTQKIQPSEWNTGKTFYVFPIDDDVVNSNNTDKAKIQTKSADSNYASKSYSIDYTIQDNDEAPKKLTVSCSGTAGCTNQQGFANCSFSLDSSNRPADKSDVKISCTSPNNFVWVSVSSVTLTNANNYSVSNINAGGGQCGAAMQGDMFGTTTLTCTATSSTGFKATGSTSIKYSYHHLEWP